MRLRHSFYKFPALILFCVCALGSLGEEVVSAQSIVWDRPAEGLAIGLWNPPPACRDVPQFLVAEIDPARYRFSVHYF
ncbi:MAG TPA: hypothetical protein VF732_04940, partial [Nitrospira sp.]